MTLTNAASTVETHAATAAASQGTAVYTGTITGGGSNALAGKTFNIAGFATAGNNGSFIASASSTTNLTLNNNAAAAETHAATATVEETQALTYVAYGAKSDTAGTYKPSGTTSKVASVSATGLITGLVAGETTVEVSYPTFNNTVGDVVSTGNIMNGLPINKVYAEVDVTVVP